MHGAAFGGAKIWNSEILPLLANWQAFPLQDGFSGFVSIAGFSS